MDMFDSRIKSIYEMLKQLYDECQKRTKDMPEGRLVAIFVEDIL